MILSITEKDIRTELERVNRSITPEIEAFLAKVYEIEDVLEITCEPSDEGGYEDWGYEPEVVCEPSDIHYITAYVLKDEKPAEEDVLEECKKLDLVKIIADIIVDVYWEEVLEELAYESEHDDEYYDEDPFDLDWE